MQPMITIFALALSVLPSLAMAADVAQVAGTNGSPKLTRAGSTQDLARGATVQPGDIVETDDHSKVKLLLSDDSVLAIGPGSRVQLDAVDLKPEGRTGRLNVLAGKFKLAVSKYFGGPTDYRIETPTAVAGVRGTVLWGDTKLDAICSLDGNVSVRAKQGKEVKLKAGACVREMAAGKTTPLKPKPDDVARYLREVTLD